MGRRVYGRKSKILPILGTSILASRLEPVMHDMRELL